MRFHDQNFIRLLPRALQFEAQIALRHLLSGGGQTILSVSAVASGVIIVIFITSLIFGLQNHWTNTLTEIIPHVTITVDELKPVPLSKLPDIEGLVSSRIEQRAPQQKNIEQPLEICRIINGIDNVKVVAPAVSSQGFISKGGNPFGVNLAGIDTQLQDEVKPITKNLIAGHYLNLASDEIVIDHNLAADLNVTVGDRVRLTASSHNTEVFRVAGIYAQGQGRGSAYITLKSAQSLLGLGSSVNVIYIKLNDIYRANETAERIRALIPYKTKSWIEEFPDFLTSLAMQTASAYLISTFSFIASSFAIASVLIVSVLQKSKQIGILKSMGARYKQIQRIFLLEGLGIAIMGSLSGALLGLLITSLLSLPQQPERIGHAAQSYFPMAIIPFYIFAAIMAAILATVVAAILPANRAAKLNPVEVMQ